MKIVLLFLAGALSHPGAMDAEKIRLTDTGSLELWKTQAETTIYHGRRALKLAEEPSGSGQLLAILPKYAFHDGMIDIDVAGALSKTATESDRGFIGIAFRMQPDKSRYECIYIRPTNGRAQDQLRRNHATQYVSLPEWPWYRLRKESPGLYESYADMVQGEWIHMKIAVHGTKAALYLGSAAQPCLVINDLRLGDAEGAIALWGGSGTIGYFANLNISNTK